MSWMLSRLLGSRPLRHRFGLLRSPNIWMAQPRSVPESRTFDEWLTAFGLEVTSGRVPYTSHVLSYAEFVESVEAGYPKLRLMKIADGPLDNWWRAGADQG